MQKPIERSQVVTQILDYNKPIPAQRATTISVSALTFASIAIVIAIGVVFFDWPVPSSIQILSVVLASISTILSVFSALRKSRRGWIIGLSLVICTGYWSIFGWVLYDVMHIHH